MISESTNRADSPDGYGTIFKRAAESRRVMLLEDLADARRNGDSAAAKIATLRLQCLRPAPDYGWHQVRDHFDRLADERLARGRHQFIDASGLIERENGHV